MLSLFSRLGAELLLNMYYKLFLQERGRRKHPVYVQVSKGLHCIPHAVHQTTQLNFEQRFAPAKFTQSCTMQT